MRVALFFWQAAMLSRKFIQIIIALAFLSELIGHYNNSYNNDFLGKRLFV